jgi:hypothetical protein
MVSMSPKHAITSKLTATHTSTNFAKSILKCGQTKSLMPENRPTPPPTDASWIKKLNAAVGLTNPKIQQQLATKMQIKYKGGVGKLIWAMMTCRPVIAFTSLKLSQSNSAQAKHHYHGLKHAI